VIFAIKGYESECLIKLVHKESSEYVCGISIDWFKKIEDVNYDEKLSKLVIKYSKGGEIFQHTIYLESPRSILMRMIEELRKDKDDIKLIGDIGEKRVEFYFKEEIKKRVSEKKGMPPEELEIRGSFRRGPDFLVYHKEGLIVIVDVKSTTKADEFPEGCFKLAKDSFNEKYFPGDYRNVEYGLPVAVFIDLNTPEDASIEDIIKVAIGDLVPNPYYSP